MAFKKDLLNPEAQGPLKENLVIDVSRWVAGPYCTNILSDMGSTVIKVESLHGDQSRTQIGGNRAAFQIYNHGKKSLAVDLEREKGKRIIYQLAEVADIFIENYRPGTAEKLGIGYQDIFKINPKIIYCSINAFGDSPPGYSQRAGVDMIMQSMGGIMSITGMPDGPPLPAGIPVADLNGAIYGYGAVLTGLYYRSITGKGQHVSVALIDTLVFSLSTRFAELVGMGRTPKKLGNAHAQIVPFQSFPTVNGWITVAVLTEQQWERFCHGIGAEDLFFDDRYSSARKRLENRDSPTEKLQEYFKIRSTQEWIEILLNADVMCAPVWDLEELVSSDLIKDHGFITSVCHPKDGTYPVLQAPFKFSQTPGQVQGPAPLLGENTYEILSILGYEDQEIKELKAGRVVKID